MPKNLLLFLSVLVATLLLALPAHGRDEDEDDDPRPKVEAESKAEAEAKAKAEAAAGNPCLTLEQHGAEKALERFARLAPSKARFESVTVRGLRAVAEAELWTAIGGKPGTPLPLESAAALVARLEELGLFAGVAPQVEGEALAIVLTENPTVAHVDVAGLRELANDELLARLLRAPAAKEARPRSAWDDDDNGTWRSRRRSRRRAAKGRERDRERPRCFAPEPPRAWVARVEGGVVKPGLVWEGLPGALERVAAHLRSEGYALASFTGTLSDEGWLRLEIDEGRLEGLDVAGVHASLRDEVIQELGLRRGDPFSVAALRAGLSRVRHRWPFLHANGSLRGAAGPERVVVEDTGGGTLRFRTLPPEQDATEWRDVSGRRRWRDLPFTWDGDDDEDDDVRWTVRRPGFRRRARAFDIDGKRLRLHLRADKANVTGDLVELFRHTEVTGFAPGLQLSLRFWDPGDRAHFTVDGLFQINTKRSGRTVEGDLWARLGAGERIDFLVGPKLQIPGLQLAELGAQLHSLTDTEDRFRISRLDSYLWSFLGNRPESEYFRRSGVVAFATLHLAERLTLGVEARLDRYGSLDGQRVPVIANRDEPAYPNPAIDEGRMSSAVFRFEWSTDPVAPHLLGSVWRSTGTSLLPRDLSEPGLRTLATLEVGTHALGSDFKFGKVISDTTLLLDAGRRSTLRLRARIAGGTGLPLQKQEALGGWEALRGFDFKEFRGDWSVLGTVEYVTHGWGLFADLGTVHQPATWTDPSLGVGGLFTVGDVRFEAAWRTDQRAHAVPEMRLLFARTF